MLLLPKKPKFLKSFASKKAATCFFKKQNKLKFSCVGLIAKESGFIPNFQIDAMRLFLRRFLKKKGQLFFRIFPDKPITKKPNQTRLGRGKGNLKYWSFYVKKNVILLEVSGFGINSIILALKAVKFKLAVKSCIFNKKF